MTRNTRNRTKAKVVAILNLVFSAASIIGLGVWLFLELKEVKTDFSTYFSSDAGKTLIETCVLVIVGGSLQTFLSVLLIFAVRENSFTKLKIWFLIETVFLAGLTLWFLVALTSPRMPYLVPIFLVIIYKSISLWIVSRLVDEMKAELIQNRLIPPFSPDLQRRDPYYSPTASHS